MKKKSYLCFVAGKSGGHLLPCIAKAQEMRAQNPDTEILFFTTKDPLDKKIIANSPLLNILFFYRFVLFPINVFGYTLHFSGV